MQGVCLLNNGRLLHKECCIGQGGAVVQYLCPELTSTQGPKLTGSVGIASAATMVTLCPSKQTVWYSREPAFMMRKRYVFPGVTVMLSWLQPGLLGAAQGC